MSFVSSDGLLNFQLHFDYSLLSFSLHLLVFRVNIFILKRKSLHLFLGANIFKIHIFLPSLILLQYGFLLRPPFLQVLYGWVHSHAQVSSCQVGRAPSILWVWCISLVQGRVAEGRLSPRQWWRGNWRRALTTEFCLVGRQTFQAQHSLLVASGPRGQRILMPLVYPSELGGSGRSSSTPVNGQVRESFKHARAASRCNQDRARGSVAGVSEGPWDMVGTGPHVPHECARCVPHLERKGRVWCSTSISFTYFPDTTHFFTSFNIQEGLWVYFKPTPHPGLSCPAPCRDSFKSVKCSCCFPWVSAGLAWFLLSFLHVFISGREIRGIFLTLPSHISCLSCVLCPSQPFGYFLITHVNG